MPLSRFGPFADVFARGDLAVPGHLELLGLRAPTAQIVLDRIARADDQKLEGQRACIETIAALRQIEGVAGVHVMGHRNEDVLVEIIREGLGRGH